MKQIKNNTHTENNMEELYNIEALDNEKCIRYKLKIFTDSDTPSPREDDNLGRIIFANRIKKLGDDHDLIDSQILANMQENPKGILRCIVNKYEHGQISFSLSNKYPYDCRFDAGKCGYIEAKHSKIIDWFHDEGKPDEPLEKLLDRAKDFFEGELRTLTAWTNGDVYYFALGSETFHGKPLDEDSCGGYYSIKDMCSEFPQCIIDKLRSEKIIS